MNDPLIVGWAHTKFGKSGAPDTMALMAEHRRVDGPTNGLGDLTSAVFLARRLSGMAEEKMLQRE